MIIQFSKLKIKLNKLFLFKLIESTITQEYNNVINVELFYSISYLEKQITAHSYLIHEFD